MLKKFCNISSTVIVAAMAVLVILLYVVNLFGIKPYTVLTGSMEPSCPVGSVVYVVKTQPEKLEIGDIVSFRLSTSTVATHRIVDINLTDGEITTKGDNNDSPDDAIPVSSIVGKVVFVIPLLGYAAAWLSTVGGKLSLCAIFVVALILMVIPEYVDKQKEAAEQADENI